MSTITEERKVPVGPEQIPWDATMVGVPARIRSWHLGPEDHGFVSLSIDFDMGGFGQGTGHYCLGGGKRGTAEQAQEALDHLLGFVGVLGEMQSWKGTLCWVLYHGKSRHGQMIAGVGMIDAGGNREYVWRDAA